MKVGEYSPISKSSQASKKKGTSSAGGDFLGLLSANEAESTSSTTPATDIQSVSSMDALLSLQEIPDNELAKRKAVQEGRNTIETLDKLRLDLLTGNVSGNIVNRLNEIVKLRKQFANDKKLDAIMQDIELRAAVELAKLERASKHS